MARYPYPSQGVRIGRAPVPSNASVAPVRPLLGEAEMFETLLMRHYLQTMQLSVQSWDINS